MPAAQTLSPSFEAHRSYLIERLVPAYASLAPLAFAYAQGSIVEGLSDTADIDVVLVWEDVIPRLELRPPSGTADLSPEPMKYDRQDTFFSSGQEFGIKHMTEADWLAWLAELDAGRGCSGWPMLVIAAHGLLSGLILFDSSGSGRTLQERLATFPEALRVQAPQRARDGLPGYLREMQRCVERGDGLLFHALIVEAAWLAWIGWFSARQLYWPLEKRLSTRLRMMARDDLAEMEERVWAGSFGLADRLASFRVLLERLMAEMASRPLLYGDHLPYNGDVQEGADGRRAS